MATDVQGLKAKLLALNLGGDLTAEGVVDEATRNIKIKLSKGGVHAGNIVIGSTVDGEHSALVVRSIECTPAVADQRVDNRLMWRLCQLATKHEIDVVEVDCAGGGYSWSLLGVGCSHVADDFAQTVRANAAKITADPARTDAIRSGLDEALASENPPHALRHLAGRADLGRQLLEGAHWTGAVERDQMAAMQRTIEARNSVKPSLETPQPAQPEKPQTQSQTAPAPVKLLWPDDTPAPGPQWPDNAPGPDAGSSVGI